MVRTRKPKRNRLIRAMKRTIVFMALLIPAALFADSYSGAQEFSQLHHVLPDPNENRLASGAPGPAYWQQRVDYKIEIELDDDCRCIIGKEDIDYKNKSPHTLDYLWLQLDQNRLRRDSIGRQTATAPQFEELSYRELRYLLRSEKFDGGFKIKSVRDENGKEVSYTIVDTMMRIDLQQPIKPRGEFSFQIEWEHNVNNVREIWGRGGYEQFDEDDNRLYTIAQFYPRLASYTDYAGWQNKQFLGNGEFTLELGDYDMYITVPAGFTVTATGELQNFTKTLTKQQQARWYAAQKAKEPLQIITREEAIANEAARPKGKVTWHYKARNVRDVAFAASRKFMWDAMPVQIDGRKVMAMSFYPKEGDALWSRYSTQAVAHTLESYSNMTFPYPYPVCISVNSPIGGMEYPMISFNGPRPEEDGTYYDVSGEGRRWDRTKYGLISVIIHEVGHNWFPMIVNSDERQWTWMDEGLNTFLQFIAEQEWEEDYPSRRGHPENMIEYMKSGNQVPIMTNSESLLQFGNNAYGKPATALNILRETVMGRELFDYSFKSYAQRWQFKRPEPADFFRSMEDTSSIDLDWFWRGWFYTTDHVDIGIENVNEYTLDTRNPSIDKPARKQEKDEVPPNRTETRNEGMKRRVDTYSNLKDFYNSYDEDAVIPQEKDDFKKLLKELEPWERQLLETKRQFYVLNFRNHGGLVMPIPLVVSYDDGSSEEIHLPAEIWRRNSKKVSRLLMTEKRLKSVEVDRHREIADTNAANNHWPRQPVKSRFQLFKKKMEENAMQKAKKAEDDKKKSGEKESSKKKKSKKRKKKSSKNTNQGD
jgi:hypothetical protein